MIDMIEGWGGVVLSALSTRLLMEDTQAEIQMNCIEVKLFQPHE